MGITLKKQRNDNTVIFFSFSPQTQENDASFLYCTTPFTSHGKCNILSQIITFYREKYFFAFYNGGTNSSVLVITSDLLFFFARKTPIFFY